MKIFVITQRANYISAVAVSEKVAVKYAVEGIIKGNYDSDEFSDEAYEAYKVAVNLNRDYELSLEKFNDWCEVDEKINIEELELIES